MGPVFEVVFEFYKETRHTISAHMSYGNSSTLVRHRRQSNPYKSGVETQRA
jgi:hypothetical protein